jgi:uncharacterized membrane protein YoaK (UPF0700 family)
MSTWLRDPRHGPLPAMLLLLTVSTGLVDAVSLLRLGRVFVANMTGNIVFIGLAVAGAPGFSVVASLTALVLFLVGAVAGGWTIARLGADRGRLVRDVIAVEVLLLLAAAVAWGLAGSAATVPAVALAALALGLQNAVARHLAVPDLTTTVLTMTLTGIGADLRRRDGRTVLRRLVAVAAMLVGALAGAALVLTAGVVAGLLAAVVLDVVVVVGAAVATARHTVPAV